MCQSPFCQPVSIDFVPQTSRCEWCGRPAVQQLTAIGGIHHNQSGFFCADCGKTFLRIVSSSREDGSRHAPNVLAHLTEESFGKIFSS